MLLVDLFVLHREAHEISLREATVLSGIWIALALIFAGGMFLFAGTTEGTQFLTGYVIEKSLSIDNVFVFALILGTFAVPKADQARVLLWGIVGALVLRAVFIFIGGELLERYDWIVYLFAAILIVTGIRLATGKHEEIHPERNPAVRAMRRLVPMTSGYHAERLWVRRASLAPDAVPQRRAVLGVWVGTPMLVVFAAIMTTDVVFALDSIPAIFAITSSTFIVFTANAFALMGLRALYFMLAGAMERFVYLNIGLAFTLIFVGGKFIYSDLVGKLPAVISLAVITGAVGLSIAASLWKTRATGDETSRSGQGSSV
ncbi:MAG: TerC/Alx family metal homeostasis membrane protein [Actinobacteria bacterium]|nr:TerC/Alx family metal homeostasis membrane protein [Actinomycetota bacterium]